MVSRTKCQNWLEIGMVPRFSLHLRRSPGLCYRAGTCMIPPIMHLRLACVVLGLLPASAWVTAARAVPAQPEPQRVVAVGDIHGAAPQLTEILRTAGIVDPQGRWSAGTTRFVQTGDITDRGGGVRAALDLLMRLEGEARRAGGRVDVLFGNHEGMNVLRDIRDVSPEALASFADKRSEDRRRKAFETHEAIARRAGTALSRDDWMRTHPPGFVEYLDAFGPDGVYGRWIRARKAMLQIDDTLFMHAGLNPATTESLDEINQDVERDIRSWDQIVTQFQRARMIGPATTLSEIANAAQVEIGRIAVAQKTGETLPDYVTRELVTALQQMAAVQKSTLIDGEGPLWYRGLAQLPDAAQPQVDALLTRFKARRIVIGHTPQLPEARIRLRYEGRVALIDTGMLTSFFKGRPSALEILTGRLTAIYGDRRDALDGAPAAGRGALRGLPPPALRTSAPRAAH